MIVDNKGNNLLQEAVIIGSWFWIKNLTNVFKKNKEIISHYDYYNLLYHLNKNEKTAYNITCNKLLESKTEKTIYTAIRDRLLAQRLFEKRKGWKKEESEEKSEITPSACGSPSKDKNNLLAEVVEVSFGKASFIDPSLLANEHTLPMKKTTPPSSSTQEKRSLSTQEKISLLAATKKYIKQNVLHEINISGNNILQQAVIKGNLYSIKKLIEDLKKRINPMDYYNLLQHKNNEEKTAYQIAKDNQKEPSKNIQTLLLEEMNYMTNLCKTPYPKNKNVVKITTVTEK